MQILYLPDGEVKPGGWLNSSQHDIATQAITGDTIVH